LDRRECHAEILRGDGEWWRAFAFTKVGNNGDVLGLGPRRVIKVDVVVRLDPTS
jgi:hypothetical protein